MTARKFTYEEKLEIADKYIDAKTEGYGSWDTLPDINSLHDADTVAGIEELCDVRLEESGLFIDFDNTEE